MGSQAFGSGLDWAAAARSPRLRSPSLQPHSVHPQSGRVLFKERGQVAWASEGGGSKESHNPHREAWGPHL